MQTKGKVVSPDEDIAAVAALQHGAFSRCQALTARLTIAGVRHRRSAGRWLDLRPGVYAMAGATATWERSVIAALLSYGPNAVAASVTAARLLRILDRDRPIYVLLPKGQHRSSKKGTIAREATLTRSDVRTVNGIRCTAPNRTIVDLAAALTKRSLEAALDDSVLLGLTTVPSLRRYIKERRLSHRRGMKVLRELLDDRTKGVTQSEFEKVFLRKLRAAGLPDPVRQHPVGKFFIDFAYPAARIAIELDSRAYHFSGKSFRSDPRRRNQIVLAGWHPFHFTWEDICDLWDVTEAVLRAALGLDSA